jgi:hypothetical protein
MQTIDKPLPIPEGEKPTNYLVGQFAIQLTQYKPHATATDLLRSGDRIKVWNTSGMDVGEEGEYDPIDVSLEMQIAHIERFRSVLGDRATFGVQEFDSTLGGTVAYHKYENQPVINLEWLNVIAAGNWPISQQLPGHDREDHIDAFVTMPPEGAFLVQEAAQLAAERRKQVLSGEETADYMIDKRFTSSVRSEPARDINYIGHLDLSTDGISGPSPQVKKLLEPLVNSWFGFSAKVTDFIDRYIKTIDTYLSTIESSKWDGGIHSKDMQAPPELGLYVGALEVISQAIRGERVSSQEIRVVLYNILKGYIQNAAILSGEELPEGALDFWPEMEDGSFDKRTNEELIASFSEPKVK